MKDLYFKNNRQNSFLKKLLSLSTSVATRVAPKIVTKVSYRVLTNPFSKRHPTFNEVTTTSTHQISSELGDITLYEFKGGAKHILLTHGWADNSSCFNSLIKELLDEGYSVWCFDHIGHGKSQGNISHLFGFIDGLKRVISFIEDREINLHSIIAHSMGGAAVLNLEEEFLRSRKIILISIPIMFFEGMFDKMDQIGISKKLLLNLLEDVSNTYKLKWSELAPNNHKDKLNENFLFIHDLKDRQCSFDDLDSYVREKTASLVKTEGLGHRRILSSKSVCRDVLEFI